MNILSKKGSALMQVLLVTAVLAGIATMLLRASISRTSAAHQVKRNVSAQLLVESCMAEVQSIFAHQTPNEFIKNMQECMFDCETNEAQQRTNFYNNPDQNARCYDDAYDGEVQNEHRCTLEENGTNHNVYAAMVKDANGKCQITYTVYSTGNL